MNNTIIIGFNNDTKTFELSKDIIQLYPNSLLSLYEASETNEKIIIEDMTYEQFHIVYSVITKKQDQWLVPHDILKFMDKYGLVDDTLLKFQNKLNMKTNEKLSRLNNFLNGDELLFSVKSIYQYEEHKTLFGNNKNIMPVQVTYYECETLCINIFDSIPIYCHNPFRSKGTHSLITGEIIKSYEIENIPITNEMDINLLRYHILLEKIKCEKCMPCENCIKLNTISFECCKPCNRCFNDQLSLMKHGGRNLSNEVINGNFRKEYIKYTGNSDINDTIYTKDNSSYLSLVESLLRNINIRLNAFNVIKSNEPNIISWNEITPSVFTNDITESLTKIIDIFINDDRDIIYNVSEDDVHDNTICYGFINITNILK